MRLDIELRELVALRDRWDEVMGHLAMLLQMLGLWRDMKFATFDQYCAERLGMATRTVQQRAWLARRRRGMNPRPTSAVGRGLVPRRRIALRTAHDPVRLDAELRELVALRDRAAPRHRSGGAGRLTASDPPGEGDRA